MQIFGSDMPGAVQYLLALVIILALLAVFSVVLKRITGVNTRFGLSGFARGRPQRLGVVDAVDIDARRQLLLLRRDNVEHLVMIGGPNDLLVESGIGRGMLRAGAPSAEWQEAPARHSEDGHEDESHEDRSSDQRALEKRESHAGHQVHPAPAAVNRRDDASAFPERPAPAAAEPARPLATRPLPSSQPSIPQPPITQSSASQSSAPDLSAIEAALAVPGMGRGAKQETETAKDETGAGSTPARPLLSRPFSLRPSLTNPFKRGEPAAAAVPEQRDNTRKELGRKDPVADLGLELDERDEVSSVAAQQDRNGARSEESGRDIPGLGAMARQLEEALKRPFAAVRPSAAAQVQDDGAPQGHAESQQPPAPRQPATPVSAPLASRPAAPRAPQPPVAPRQPASAPVPPPVRPQPPVQPQETPDTAPEPVAASPAAEAAPRTVGNVPFFSPRTPIGQRQDIRQPESRPSETRVEPQVQPAAPHGRSVPPPPPVASLTLPEPERPSPAVSAPVQPVVRQPVAATVAPAQPAAAEKPAAPKVEPAGKSDAAAKSEPAGKPETPRTDPFSLEDIEAEFARLLGRTPSKPEK